MPAPPLILPTATRLTVRLTGGPVQSPTAGYRNWEGQFESAEPIVALVVGVSGRHVSWARTTHRGAPIIPARILFSPTDEEGLRIRVCFSILDATAYGDTVFESIQTGPTPPLKSYPTGELVSIATVTEDPVCELMALFLARRDVVSVRRGVWHARGEVVAPLTEPWRGVLIWGRTGEFEVA